MLSARKGIFVQPSKRSANLMGAFGDGRMRQVKSLVFTFRRIISSSHSLSDVEIVEHELNEGSNSPENTIQGDGDNRCLALRPDAVHSMRSYLTSENIRGDSARSWPKVSRGKEVDRERESWR